MHWMQTSAPRRGDPRAQWPEVRSIIMLGVNYAGDEDPLAILQQRDRGAISVYARGDDYHDVIKRKLKALAAWLQAGAGGQAKAFVDTAAVMEKPLAAAAHLSAIDYLGDVPWNEDETAKTWYARIKSRPSFRPLLGEAHAGMPPSTTYADLDF